MRISMAKLLTIVNDIENITIDMNLEVLYDLINLVVEAMRVFTKTGNYSIKF